MQDLILYLGITIIGYFVGAKARSHREAFFWTGKTQTVAITILVLMMGARMGANKEVTQNLGTIGLSAFAITVVVMAFSVAGIYMVRKLMGIDKKGYFVGRCCEKLSSEGCSEVGNEGTSSSQGSRQDEKTPLIDRMTLIILGCVIIGMAAGYTIIRRVFEGEIETFDSFAGTVIKVGLCVLLFFVGLDLGIEGTVVENFKAVGLRILAIPVAVIAGTMLASVLVSFFIDLTIAESLAVGCGFGWYTLAPGIIMEAGHLTASAISFLHNVMRETFAILLMPIVAKKVGYVEVVGMPGAAAMDVCLPLVEKATRGDIVIYSFVSGVVLSCLVPALVPLFV